MKSGKSFAQRPQATGHFQLSEIHSKYGEECVFNLPRTGADPIEFDEPMKVKLATKRKKPPKVDYETTQISREMKVTGYPF